MTQTNRTRMYLTDDEIATLEDVLAYYTMAAGPDGSFGGGSPSEEDAETYDLANGLLDRVSGIRQRKGI